MVQTGEGTGYLNVILESERSVGLLAKWALLAVGVLSTGFLTDYRSVNWLAVGVVGYALLNLLFTYLFAFSTSAVRRTGAAVYFLSYATDIAFASQVVYYSGGASSEMHLLYALLALKSAVLYPAWHQVLLFPFATGFLYVLTLRLSAGSWYFLTETFFLQRYLLLLGAVLLAVYLGWINERGRVLESVLRRNLAERNVDLDNKTHAMQQMATNLGNRVLELRTMQEGIKAINSALALENVLHLIVANASQVLDGARCSVAVLDSERGQVQSMATTDEAALGGEGARFSFDLGVTSRVVQDAAPVLSSDVRRDSRFATPTGLEVSAVIGVPLVVDGKAIGALTATSSERDAFTIEDLNLLGTFADQAAVAVKNARLYEQLAQEQRQTAQLYQHVQERRNELEAILRGIGDGVIVTDPELNLLLMNPVATRGFRVKSDVTSSKPLSEMIPHQELVALFHDALRGTQDTIVREITLGAGGGHDEVVHQAVASPIRSPTGDVRGVVTVLRDITSQKELEKMKSNFLSVVSHELRTPLHSIKGFVDIILMGKTGPVTETQADFLSTVRDQTGHLQNLINDLLEFSRLESGQVKLRLTEVSLARVAGSVMDKLRPLADQNHIHLISSVPPDLPVVEADQMRIEQVLTNLVDNAVKFTPAAGTVTIGAADLGERVQVAVSDTGIGIPAAELERVFERFYQVNSGSTRPYRGTGLGLTICKHIVEHHGGRIWAESEEGKGSTFFFNLPKHIVAEEDRLLLDFLSLPEQAGGQNHPTQTAKGSRRERKAGG